MSINTKYFHYLLTPLFIRTVEYLSLKMQAAVILTAATMTMALENGGSVGAFKCEADHQCQSGYCYRDTGYCAPCTDCAEYLRQPSEWRSCAREPEDCGPCLPGFDFEYLTYGSVRSFCVQKKQSAKDVNSDTSHYVWALSIGAGIIVLFVMSIIIIKVYQAHKMRADVRNSNPDVEDPPPLPPGDNGSNNPPPPYDSSVPLLRRTAVVSSARETSLNVIEKEEGNLPQAVPFSNPYPPYGSGGLSESEEDGQDFPDYPIEMDHLGNPPEDEDEVHYVPSPPQLEDEDTMPSDWIPGPGYANVQSPINPDVPSSQSVNSHSAGLSSGSSSLSNISAVDVAIDVTACAQVLNDSGVSASCSHQSDLSSTDIVDSSAHVLVNGQNATDGAMNTVLERCRSDEDLSSLAEIRANKRQRCDSGSSSMKSFEPY